MTFFYLLYALFCLLVMCGTFLGMLEDSAGPGAALAVVGVEGLAALALPYCRLATEPDSEREGKR